MESAESVPSNSIPPQSPVPKPSTLPEDLQQLQAISPLEAFPTLEKVIKLKQLDTAICTFKEQFEANSNRSKQIIKNTTNRICESADSYFDQQFTQIGKAILEMEARQKPEKVERKGRQSKSLTKKQSKPKNRNHKKTQKQVRRKVIIEMQSSSVELLEPQLEMSIQENQENPQQKRESQQIYMCCCFPSSQCFFFDAKIFIQHLMKRHPSSQQFNNFRDNQLKMTHFMLFNKLVVNPWCKKDRVVELLKFQRKMYGLLFVCGCLFSGVATLLKSVTFCQEEFITHIKLFHKSKPIEGSTHTVNFQTGSTKKAGNFNEIMAQALKLDRFRRIFTERHIHLRSNLTNEKVSVDLMICNPKFTRVELFQDFEFNEIRRIFICSCCRIIFNSEAHLKSHLFFKKMSPSTIQTDMIFDFSHEYATKWLDSISTKIPGDDEPIIIKCGCSLHTFSNFSLYQKHIKECHNEIVPNFSSHSRLPKKRMPWRINLEFSQELILKEMQINNHYLCGFCPKVLFGTRRDFFIHIIRRHKSFHPKNSHYLKYFEDESLYESIQNPRLFSQLPKQKPINSGFLSQTPGCCRSRGTIKIEKAESDNLENEEDQSDIEDNGTLMKEILHLFKAASPRRNTKCVSLDTKKEKASQKLDEDCDENEESCLAKLSSSCRDQSEFPQQRDERGRGRGKRRGCARAKKQHSRVIMRKQ